MGRTTYTVGGIPLAPNSYQSHWKGFMSIGLMKNGDETAQ